MGRLSHIDGHLSCPSESGPSHRLVLFRAGRREYLYAGADGDAGRPQDGGAAGAEYVPRAGRSVYDCRLGVCLPGRDRAFRHPLHPLYAVGSVLYAHHRAELFGGLCGAGEGGLRHREGLSAHPRVGHCGLHLDDVDYRPHRPAEDPRAVDGQRSHKSRDGCLLPDDAANAHQARRAQVAGRGPRPERLQAVPESSYGYVLRLRDAAGLLPADLQRLCQPLHHQLRCYRGVPEHLRRAARQHPHLAVADERDAVHSPHPLLPLALRHQEGGAHGPAGLGVALRLLRLGQPGWRGVALHPLDDCLWRGLRLLQHQRFAVREPGDRREHPQLGTGPVHDDDQRSGCVHRHTGGAGCHQQLCVPPARQRRHGARGDCRLADLMVHLRRLRPRRCHCLRPLVQRQQEG